MADCEIEDGEILSEEETPQVTVQTEKQQSKTIDAYNVLERPDYGYRTANRNTVYSSDEEIVSGDSSDEDSPVAKKQSRKGNQQGTGAVVGGYKKDSSWLGKAHQSIVEGKGKKPNNIWGAVLEEEKMTKFVNQLNRNENISYEERGAESYDYTRVKNDPRLKTDEDKSESSDSESSSEDEEETKGPADLTEKETFGFVPEKPKSVKSRLGTRKRESQSSTGESSDMSGKEDTKQDNNSHKKGKKRWSKKEKRDRKRERSMDVDMKMECIDDRKSKAGQSSSQGKQNRKRGRNEMKGNKKKDGYEPHPSRRPKPDNVKEIKPMKHVEITDGMEDMELVDTIIDALQETQEQTDLFLRILDQLGREKLMKLFRATEDIEDMGGLMIQNGSRRRTPGGVFLYLIRSDCDVTTEQKNIMFAEQRAEYKAQCKQWKKEKRKWLRRKRAEEKRELEEKLLGNSESKMDTDSKGDGQRESQRKDKSTKETNGKVVEKIGNGEVCEKKSSDEEDGELEDEELVDIQLE